MNNVGKAAALVDKTRHNGGAVLSFVDGHVEWIPAINVTAGLFWPSIADLSQITEPISFGAGIPVAKTDGAALMSALNPLSLTIMMAGASPAYFYDGKGNSSYGTPDGTGAIPASLILATGSGRLAPSWWATGPGKTTLTGFSGGSLSFKWGVDTVYCNEASYAPTKGVMTLTIVPNVAAPTVKRFAVIGFNSAVGSLVTATVDSIVLGTQTYSTFAPPLAATTPGALTANATVCAIPVKPNTPITLNLGVVGAGTAYYASMCLAFED
ncbi:MAG: H-X9-DG-CTERM domain-containing protein [Armatimonadota bacterium]